ncbi:MAG: sigma 54-interacting transcriptional regulator [Proteobacteria bacterium]|nr:sigma 54-interacting transcriptional regulator [Pseudomonadota bacterium]
MNTLRVYRGGELIHDARLGSCPLEIGSAADCDLRVQDPEIGPRHWLVREQAGSVVAYDVGGGKSRRSLPLPLAQPVPLGRHHRLLRVQAPQTKGRGHARGPSEGPGDRGSSCPPGAALSLVVGCGQDARRFAVRDKPISVGSASENQLVLHDQAVSPQHCRFQPSRAGLLVKDLGSRNGTYLDGVRVQQAYVLPGSRIRLGRTDLWALERRPAADPEFPIAASVAMRQVLAEATRYARLPWPVLLLGETGCGKEVLARRLHEQSARPGRFVALNAGGLPAQLVESELFGHERGSFTGATNRHCGAFEQAHRGTLFLDEIGELPLALQARLLRVLETWRIRRVGAESELAVDVRLVCATHRDLRSLAGSSEFRLDLYYRLARLVIEIAPLRERADDIEPLAAHFLRSIQSQVGPRSLSPEALALLRGYSWPGNARELMNVLCIAAAAGPSPCIERDDVAAALRRITAEASNEFSPKALRRVVDGYGGNVAAAARALGVPRTTLRDRIKP